MLIQNNNILILSTMGIDDLPTRKQLIAKYLSQENHVVYVQPPLTLLGALKNRKWEKGRIVKQNERLVILQPPLILPFGLKHGIIQRINAFVYRSFIKKMLKKMSVQPDILWFYLIDFPSLADAFPSAIKVYDCVDDHSAYPGWRSPAFVRKLEQRMVQSCDVIFSTTRELARKLSPKGKKVHVISNGVDWEHFGDEQVTEMEDIMHLPHPRIGYLGAIHHWFDLPLVKAILESIPQAHIILAGPSNRTDLDTIKGHPRMHVLGRISVEKAPSCIKAFDVCLIPFVPNDLTLNISPLKFFEYCALGKPTVSIPICQLQTFKDICYFYHDTASCIESIKSALSESKQKKQERKNLARDNSWDKKLEEMFSLIQAVSPSL